MDDYSGLVGYVPPETTANGGQIGDASYAGDPKEVARLREKMLRHMMTYGEPLNPPAQPKQNNKQQEVKKKKTKKKTEAKEKPPEDLSSFIPAKTNMNPTPSPSTPVISLRDEFQEKLNKESAYKPVVEYPQDLIDVEFITAFGTIILTTTGITQGINHIALFFKNKKDIKFIPKAGETIEIKLPNDRIVNVYCPNIIVDDVSSEEKIMILIKKDSYDDDTTDSDE